MIIATAGHVDHGKTLLVKALTGTDTDRLPEEKKRGLTIELGFAFHDLGDGEPVGFIDVPGHERFVHTMVAGVAGTDAVLLVIAADDGPMPQTVEHLAILDLLGVTRGVVALTKVDRVDASRGADVSRQIQALLSTTSLAGIDVIPVSAVTGFGIEPLRTALYALKATVPARSRAGNFRLAIDRSFVLKGAGRVVTGTVFSGSLNVGDTVCHAPGGGELRVRSLHVHNAVAELAEAGQRCALNLAGPGLTQHEIHRGDWIVGPEANFGTRGFDADVRVLASEVHNLRSRTPVHVHVGSAEVTGRFTLFEGSGLAPAASAVVHVALDRELHMVRGDRFILRDQSSRRTVGGGVVINPFPEHGGRNRVERTAYRNGFRLGEIDLALDAVLSAQPAGIDFTCFTRAWNLRADEVDALRVRAALVTYGPQEGPSAMSAGRWQGLQQSITTALGSLHKAEPARAGLAIPELRQALPAPIKLTLLNALLAAMMSAGVLGRTGGLWHLAGHVAERAPEDAALWRRVRPLLEVPDNQCPVVHDLAESLTLNQARLETFLLRSAKSGEVVRVSPKRYFLPSAIERFAAVACELARQLPGGGFAAAEFRNAAGIGRNAAIEVLEYFDRVGLTRRQGETRILLRKNL